MANLSESSLFEAGVYQIEITDPVIGGVPSFVDGKPVAGHSNAQAMQLANRTKWLYDNKLSISDLANTTDSEKGASLVGFKPVGSTYSGRNVAEKLGTFIDVRDFGAVGDGVTDDTLAIQTALNSVSASTSMMVLFLGTFKVSQTLVVKPNTHIAGVHRIVSRIVRSSNYGHTLTCGDDSTGAQGFKCTDIEFYHGSGLTGSETTLPDMATSGAHIYMRGGNMVFIERCSFHRMRYSIMSSGGAWCHIKNNLFFGIWDDNNVSICEGVAAIQTTDDPLYGHCVEWWVEGNNFAGPKKSLTGYPIVSADGTYYTTVEDGFTYVLAPALALEILALESCTISNNYFGGSNRYAIAFIGKDRGGYPFNPFNIRICNNMFDPSLVAQVGFVASVANCHAWNIIITGNTFIGDRNGRNAIHAVKNGTTNTPSVIGLQVTGNTINGHYGSGILLDGASGFNITGNTITDYNKLGAASTDTAFVAGVAVRDISSRGLVANNTIGGGPNFSGVGHCVEGVTVQVSATDIVQSGNHRVGTTNWTAQTYPA